MTISCIQVAVPTPLRRQFDYLTPGNTPPVIGARVLVPFGRRTVTGIVTAINITSTLTPAQLKPIIEIIDYESLFDASIWDLCHWISRYYHHSLGEVLMAALPVALRKKKRADTLTQILQIPTPLSQLLATVPLTLNHEQQLALHTVLDKQTQFNTFLLDGVTGSGKTEVYLQIIAEIIASGKQTLVLIPEIALTPQTIMRFRERFNTTFSILHSGLTERERYKNWCLAKTGTAKIIIGTRSALFTPMAYPGLIIVDEEHDASFKQHEGLRYHARDAAVYRAQRENIPIILGSATPSLESFYNAEMGRYHSLALSQRAGQAILPSIEIVDLRKTFLQHGLAKQVLDAIKTHLDREEQVLLFLNRRGYAAVLLCHACGVCARCRRCDVYLTLHYDPKRLICHHCGAVEKFPEVCPSCQQPNLIDVGVGTEKMEQFLQHYFKVPIIRIDSDNTRKKGSLENLLQEAHQLSAGILVGTQMLAKGHHFPKVTLVVIVNIDGGLCSADFHAVERMGQLLLQVAGRAGRAEKPGKVLLQTHYPDHPLLPFLQQHDYHRFLQQLLLNRRQQALPPVTYGALLHSEAVNHELPLHFLQNVKAEIMTSLSEGVEILGPIPATIERIAGRYRAQLFFISRERRALHDTLKQLLNIVENLATRRVRWALDIDPIEC